MLCFKYISLKSNINENTKFEDEIQSECKFCVNDYKRTIILKIVIQNLSVVKKILKIVET